MKKGDLVWGIALVAFISLFIFPSTASVLFKVTDKHPYIMGFSKFSVFATMGELLTYRMAKGSWKIFTGFLFKALVWGIIGMLTVLMFNLYSSGVKTVAAAGLLPVGKGILKSFLLAFWTSAIMNLTFSPVFMAVHRIVDVIIVKKMNKVAIHLSEIIQEINWEYFASFILGKTIPFFWIPAHTVAFLLPSDYRVLFAALLSIILGIILSWGERKA
ncbi:Mpv17/PMP22 [uncultured spirochete]|uniref:Mpv17/PMP22 n=1 Tax=uncultured spirochete TaxID=156406 RepID=A0A3P3XQV5_9SPIR|nr:Mpv17/PMP22 [uncultured spirochete]